MNILFACGGTAGHVYPAIAVAEKLKTLLPDTKVRFIGAKGKMEADLIPRKGFDIETITITNLRRSVAPKAILHNLGTMKNIITASKEARQIIKRFQPNIVVGTGGYVCYPVIKQAAKLGIPTIIHEANRVPGLTTKRLAKCANYVMVGFEDAKAAYQNTDKVVYTGIPVRSGFSGQDKTAARIKLGVPMDKPLVVSFWGSLGATKMNESLRDTIRQNYASNAWYHIHATGGGEDRAKAMIQSLATQGATDLPARGIHIHPFLHDMEQAMAAADLIICRAGASTLAELTAAARPAILVPSPYVTANHQEENAKVFAEQDGAILLKDADATGDRLFAEIKKLTATPDVLVRMGRTMGTLGKKNATEEIVKIILDQIKT